MMITQEIIQQTLECIVTAKDAANELYEALKSEKICDFKKTSSEMSEFLLMLQHINDKHNSENNSIKLSGAIDSALDSLTRIDKYSDTNLPLALHKIEFELIPFISTMYAEYYFWSEIFPNREKWESYFKNEMPELYANQYIEKSVKTGKYKYDLSILVVGYNKLEYTKSCVSSVLANLPEDVSYELILLNHGSNDGTKEYFESVKPTKQMDIKVNNSLNFAYTRIIEGEYYLAISNDTIITPNAIQNMLRTIREDKSIGKIAPTTPNVSNLQTIPADYNNYEELMSWVKKNNIYDIFRHEVRTRLCDPISMCRSSVFFSSSGINMYGRYYTSGDIQALSFPDDEVSMLLRRAGLKSVLAKDAYCFHFGSVTIKSWSDKEKIDMNKGYENGRIEFKKAFGIDPWGTGFCYDYGLFQNFDCKFEGHIEILGINCGMGSNSLKVKEIYKEKRHNLEVFLTNYVNEEILLNEVSATSDEVQLIKAIADISDITDKKYHYIVFEDAFRKTGHESQDIELLADYLTADGELYVKSNKELISIKLRKAERIGNWLKFTSK